MSIRQPVSFAASRTFFYDRQRQLLVLDHHFHHPIAAADDRDALHLRRAGALVTNAIGRRLLDDVDLPARSSRMID
jgi:hypothetical protein